MPTFLEFHLKDITWMNNDYGYFIGLSFVMIEELTTGTELTYRLSQHFRNKDILRSQCQVIVEFLKLGNLQDNPNF